MKVRLAQLKTIVKQLELIDGVIVNYSQGRRLGMSDDTVEGLALEGISNSINLLEEIIEAITQGKVWI